MVGTVVQFYEKTRNYQDAHLKIMNFKIYKLYENLGLTFDYVNVPKPTNYPLTVSIYITLN